MILQQAGQPNLNHSTTSEQYTPLPETRMNVNNIENPEIMLRVQGAALSAKGQHPCGDPGCCTGNQGTAPLWDPRGSKGLYLQSGVSAPVRGQGAALAVKGQHPCGIQGTVLIVRGQHPCLGPSRLYWQPVLPGKKALKKLKQLRNCMTK